MHTNCCSPGRRVPETYANEWAKVRRGGLEGSSAPTPGRRHSEDTCETMRLARLMAVCVGALVGAAAAISPITPPSQFHLPGDYILGGLFSLHAEVVGKPHLHYSEAPEAPLCKEYKLKVVSYSYLQAMRFAVEEINNSSVLLPGISLGYEMVDVCYLTNTVLPVLYFLSDTHCQIEIRTNWTGYRPRAVAVIGPDSSPAAVTMAYILSQFLVPQITFSATTEALSNPRLFPAAFRTIPSTEQQVAVMLGLLRWFRWNWVIILASDDDYGQQNLQLLRAQATWPCIAFQETIPVQQGLQDSNDDITERIRDIVRKIGQSSAQVVIVLSLELPLSGFFEEVMRQNVSGLVWIGAEAWATDPSVHNISNLASVGTIFGVAVRNIPIPGLSDFRVRVPSYSPPGDASAPPVGKSCNQDCDECLAMARVYDKIFRETGHRIDFNVYSAVYVVAHALHRLLRCGDSTGCRRQTVYPWQLLEVVSQVNFTLLNTTIKFNEMGDPPNGFEVVQWRWDVPGEPFRRIATYDSLAKKLDVYEKNIVWHTQGNTAVKSICSEQCQPGEKKSSIGLLSCCFACVKCEAGTFLNKSDNYTCQRCPPDMWSHPSQEECFMRQVMYLHWEEPASIVLLLCGALGILASLGTLATLTRHSDTPVVKSAGGSLCFLMLASLLAGFCSIPFYIGRPTELKCACRQTVFTLCFTLCISCLTARSFQVVFVFKVAHRLPRAYNFWMKYHGPRVFIAAVSVAKVLFVATNMASHQPAPVEYMVGTDPAQLILVCNESHRSSMLANNVFDMGLSFLCFSFAYLGRALPKNYNEAKYITLCMASYFASWVCLFLVTSLLEGTVVTVLDATVILSNLFGLLLGYFGSKCYVIFFHPERNTAAFFQTAIQSYTMRQE